MLQAIMPLPALVLILASGVILAIWNLLVKKAADPSVLLWGAVTCAVALYTPVFFVALLPTISGPPWQAWAATALAGLTEGVYFILLTTTYRRGDLSLVYPVSRGSAPLFILAGGALLLTERVTAAGFVGIGLIVGGIAAVAWPGRGVRVTGRAVFLSVATGAAIAAHHVCYKWALAFIPPPAAIYVAWAIATVTLGLYCLATRPFFQSVRYLHDHLVMAIAVGAIAMGGFLCTLYALNMTLVSYVGAARNVGIIFGVLFGAQLLGEGARGRRLAGAAAITVGVAALAFA